jgi:hypothetical protein
MESPPASLVELGTGEASVALPLTSTEIPFNSVAPRRELFVRRQVCSDSAKVLVIVERSILSEGTITETRRYLDLSQDFVLPIYAIPRRNRTEWNVEVGYGRGTDRVDYPFRTRESAFRFQQLVTDYQPVQVFENVTCVVTYYRRLRIPLPQYVGTGHIQFWAEARHDSNLPAVSPSPESSVSSQSSQTTPRATSTASIHSLRPSLVQTYSNRTVLVVRDPRPPLLVAFLKDRGGENEYTMLKMKSKLAVY